MCLILGSKYKMPLLGRGNVFGLGIQGQIVAFKRGNVLGLGIQGTNATYKY
ncbi:hypothetical protein [Bacillus sp. AFS031507]|uniref:hypothetical protein n=1 Tax=Bacillus sp. AFS031507 TaxID=2033496 RepID=UPI0015D50740|nr:hypothetical protein [Bacillus sp. AFS031507]